jgi:hypothetical protein
MDWLNFALFSGEFMALFSLILRLVSSEWGIPKRDLLPIFVKLIFRFVSSDSFLPLMAKPPFLHPSFQARIDASDGFI